MEKQPVPGCGCQAARGRGHSLADDGVVFLQLLDHLPEEEGVRMRETRLKYSGEDLLLPQALDLASIRMSTRLSFPAPNFLHIRTSNPPERSMVETSTDKSLRHIPTRPLLDA